MKRATPIFALALLGLAAALPAAAADLDDKLDAARRVYLELMRTPDRAAPADLARDAHCIAVFPNVIKGAFGWGGRHGQGVVSCRRGGDWSAPAFFHITGGSFGWQIGGQSTDLVLFFMNDHGARSLLKSKFTLGADASIAAGPMGREAQASTDLRMRAEILSYAKTRGLYAGASLEGLRIAASQGRILDYYDERVFPEEILFTGTVTNVPASAKAFLDVLP